MPDPLTLVGSSPRTSSYEVSPEEQAAGACLPRTKAARAEEAAGSAAVEQLVEHFKLIPFSPTPFQTPTLAAFGNCLPELVAASLTCAATSATAAPTLGASLVAASVCIGAGASAGRCLANATAASELRALEQSAAKVCEDDGGVPLAVHADGIVCLIP